MIFGTQGELPTHPQLLDWLAHRFVESKWNTKALIYDIVTSANLSAAVDIQKKIPASRSQKPFFLVERRDFA